MALIDIVQWSGTPDTFAWRFPESNLTTLTQLIVNQSQEAVLFHKGELLKTFGPGKHTLSTENIPILEKLYGIPFGGKNPFTAEVWFVNKVFSLDIKWGTASPFLIRDPEFGVMIPVRGFGQFGIRIANAETFLVKLVGTLPVFGKEQLTTYFRGLLMSRATSILARTMQNEKISVLDIAAHIALLSEALHGELLGEFEKYGIELINFYISQISIPEEDPSVVKLKETLSKRADMAALGYTYQQERSFNVLENAAQNEGTAGTIMGAGMGLGMGVGIGKATGQMMNEVTGAVRKPECSCPSCGHTISQDAQFCSKCGAVRERSFSIKNSCGKCHATMPSGAKFCPACGAKATTYCAVCGQELVAGQAFCTACGVKSCFD